MWQSMQLGTVWRLPATVKDQDGEGAVGGAGEPAGGAEAGRPAEVERVGEAGEKVLRLQNAQVGLSQPLRAFSLLGNLRVHEAAVCSCPASHHKV